MSGVVKFAQVSPNRTRITLEIIYDPEGFVEKTGDALGIVSSGVDNDLERFKEFIENRGQEPALGAELSMNSHRSCNP
jgi:uncharacterized membrane protein